MDQHKEPAAQHTRHDLHPSMLLAAKCYLRSRGAMWAGLAVTATANLFLAAASIWNTDSGSNLALFIAMTVVPIAAGYFGYSIGSLVKAAQWAISMRRVADTPILPGLSLARWAKALVDGSWTAHTLATHMPDEGDEKRARTRL